jgi:hypothetical protein
VAILPQPSLGVQRRGERIWLVEYDLYLGRPWKEFGKSSISGHDILEALDQGSVCILSNHLIDNGPLIHVGITTGVF